MASYYLLMDVGGTEIKAGIVNRKGSLCGPMEKFPAHAKESKDVIIADFAFIIDELGGKLPLPEDTVCGIGMAFPGPFDYENGISLMKGLDKYDAIYGCVLQDEILKKMEKKEILEDEKTSFLFLHDVEAFATGESHFGAAADAHRLLCLCIGTGAGSAFVENGIARKSGEDVPENGWLYNTPFQESIIDDYISVRGLRKQAEARFKEPPNGAELYQLALAGNKDALTVFENFGQDFYQAVKPFMEMFRPDAIVLGGQISRSFSFFGTKLELFCKAKGIQIVLTSDTSIRTLEGLYVTFEEVKKQGAYGAGYEQRIW